MDQITTELIRQHLELLDQIRNVYTALAIIAFLGLLFLVVVCGLAVWSVQMVNRRQSALEGKFTLLIDVLLEQARQRNVERTIAAATSAET